LYTNDIRSKIGESQLKNFYTEKTQLISLFLVLHIAISVAYSVPLSVNVRPPW